MFFCWGERVGCLRIQGTHYTWMKRSKWVDPGGSWNDIKFPQVLDAYLKAEAKHLISTVFQKIRRDPARIVEFVESARKRPSVM